MQLRVVRRSCADKLPPGRTTTNSSGAESRLQPLAGRLAWAARSLNEGTQWAEVTACDACQGG